VAVEPPPQHISKRNERSTYKRSPAVPKICLPCESRANMAAPSFRSLAIEAANGACLAMYLHHVSSPRALPTGWHLTSIGRWLDRNVASFSKAVVCCFQFPHLRARHQVTPRMQSSLLPNGTVIPPKKSRRGSGASGPTVMPVCDRRVIAKPVRGRLRHLPVARRCRTVT
jgi:hypothetical protein